MQPLRLAADAKTRLVHVLDRCARHEIARHRGKTGQPRRAGLAHPGQGCGRQSDAEQIGHQLDEAIFRHKLHMQQIDHESGYPGTILHRRVDAGGKGGAGDHSAGPKTHFLFYGLPLLIWMAVIFSASTGAGSSAHSYRIVKFLVSFIREKESDLTYETLDSVNLILRKAAHLTEYSILALLTARFIQFGAAQLKRITIPGAWGFCVVYASLDEFHQSFVPGRTPAVRDVMIDSSGALAALLLMGCWFGVKWLERKSFRIQNSTTGVEL